MCRNIRILFNFDPPADDAEIQAAALQYVRKVSGTTRPNRGNEPAFERAVAEVAAITRRLIREELQATGKPRNREQERERARERGRQRDVLVRRRLGISETPAPTIPTLKP